MKFRVYSVVALLLLALCHNAPAQERLPAQLAGTWRIVRILPSTNVTCWSTDQAKPLLGTSLTYQQRSMRWKGGAIPLIGIASRSVTPENFARDYAGLSLDLPAGGLTEVNLQHEDMDITGSTTEVPGDSILMVSPGRIVVSACGVFFEATRPRPAH